MRTLTLDPRAIEIIKRLNKRLGEDTVILGSQARTWERLPSGSLGLDLVLGGGWPVNCWHEIIGEESAGKSHLAFSTVAANQRRDPDFTTVWFAAEEFVPAWAEACGVDTSRVIVVETNIMEDVYDAAEEFTQSRAVDAVVLDSLPALVPGAEDEKTMGESTVGRGALLTGKFFRKIGIATKRSSINEGERPFLGLVINQWRMKIGTMYGDPRTTPGGLAKNYAYTCRVEVRRDDWIEAGVGKDKERIGQVIKATTRKNKSAPPNRHATYDMYFDDGGVVPPGRIDYAKEICSLAAAYELVTRAGAFYRYGDQSWQGKDNFLNAVREDAELWSTLERDVLQVAKKLAA